VLSVVSAGLSYILALPGNFAFQTRLQTKIVWDTVAFVINGLIFILIGLQMPGIISGFKDYGFTQMLGVWHLRSSW
jgi:CPA1 family monovalent cation:H+ antiporter